MKFLEYVKTREHLSLQKKRGWKIGDKKKEIKMRMVNNEIKT